MRRCSNAQLSSAAGENSSRSHCAHDGHRFEFPQLHQEVRKNAYGFSLIASFGKGIKTDLAAVRAALTEPWSNGQTEGQITKLKLVKRQMYGRAKLDLLRARLIVPA